MKFLNSLFISSIFVVSFFSYSVNGATEKQGFRELVKTDKVKVDRIKVITNIKKELTEEEIKAKKKAEKEKIKAEKIKAKKLEAEKAKAEKIKAKNIEDERIKRNKAEMKRIRAEETKERNRYKPNSIFGLGLKVTSTDVAQFLDYDMSGSITKFDNLVFKAPELKLDLRLPFLFGSRLVLQGSGSMGSSSNGEGTNDDVTNSLLYIGIGKARGYIIEAEGKVGIEFQLYEDDNTVFLTPYVGYKRTQQDLTMYDTMTFGLNPGGTIISTKEERDTLSSDMDFNILLLGVQVDYLFSETGMFTLDIAYGLVQEFTNTGILHTRDADYEQNPSYIDTADEGNLIHIAGTLRLAMIDSKKVGVYLSGAYDKYQVRNGDSILYKINGTTEYNNMVDKINSKNNSISVGMYYIFY
ncbi:MAG: hypothetical protein JJV96_00870 [Alphaproteobacteria bacterium]|nr:hypothetical protein [Alphaproteobacteria bacterium]